MSYYTWKIFYNSPTQTIPAGQIKLSTRETDPGGIRPWVHRGSNLGRGANPNPAYPESNFGSFEDGPPHGRASRKKSSTADEKRREKEEERETRDFRWIPKKKNLEERRRETFPCEFLAISAQIAYSSRFRSRKLARKKGAEREGGRKGRERESGRFSTAIKLRQKEKLSATSV